MATADLDEFRALGRRPSGKAPCGVALETAGLSRKERAKLHAACAEPTISNSAILRWLAKHDVRTNNSALTSHRRQTCTCGNA